MDFSNLTEAQLEEITAPGPEVPEGETADLRRAWVRFGEAMNLVHDSVYEEKPVKLRKPFPVRGLWRVGIPTAVVLLLGFATLFLNFNQTKVVEFIPDDKLEWDALDAEFEQMNTQLSRISRDESPVDTEIATLFDSLEAYDSSLGEDFF